MLIRRVVSSSVLCLALATSAAAQSAGTWEIGASGHYREYAAALTMQNKGGGGLSVGYFPLARLELEAAVSVISTAQPGGPLGDVTNVPIYARLIYNQPVVSSLQLLLGAGYIQNTYESAGEWYGDSGVTGLLGLRLGLGRTLALRLAGTADYLPAYVDDVTTSRDATSLGFEAGLSVLLGGRPRPSGTEVFVEPRAWEPQPAEPEEEPAPSDSDADGVTDDADLCPGTPTGATVEADGCQPPAVEEEPAPVEVEEVPAAVVVAALPEPDADSDGVPDSLDRCPGTVADDVVDSGGCSITRDSDGDGVVDSSDRCENTAPGTRVDSTGCPALFGEGETKITLNNAFKPGTWDLKPEARAKLDGIAQTLIANPSIRIAIAGYTDSSGSERRNTWLSQTRADAVKLYLRENGVPRERMTARGYGPADPVASNDTAEGRALNRRIELRKLE